MIPTDLEVADLLQNLYDCTRDDTERAFPEFDYVGDVHGIEYGMKDCGDCEVVALRGSVTPEDWMRDAAAVPFPHSGLGDVHAGFLIGMDDMLKEISTAKPLLICGHSLGAARASILTGLALLNGLPVVRRVCFGEPNAGMEELSEVVNKAPGVSYRNTEGWQVDLVTVIPFVPHTFCHPTSPIRLHAKADPDEHSPFRLHHMPLYRAALAEQMAVKAG